ncbi:uncharacterized protein N7496_012352 [Penicillium cataractarum]|uniref:Uncharacterized protein n=1 Tax=Penicillium cataractarum TaxID=2100454 RepID=A0A9W9R8X0_9EURO|nr:uncharacterized protein N7496_012352 [Penicillium cataractarum]KAJ5355140.1 hypothetical protein N7496_012352 [Penicillium cataractarum]
MSNFMHKVKDAVTESHDRDRVPNSEVPGAHNTYKSSNPYTKDPVASQNNPSMMDHESGPGTNRLGNHGGARGPDTYSSATTGANTVNSGPHNSKLANKLDPRVDSDLDLEDHRAQNAGTMGSQNLGAAPQGMNAGNMATGEKPRVFGSDNHTSNEDNYSKSTQEHKTHTQPSVPGSGNQVTSEDTSSSSSQEHKSHSSTTHTTPCQMNPRPEPGLEGRAMQPEFGGGAAGGSSYTQPPVREPAGMQNTNRMGKADPQVQGMGYEQNDLANQRSAY